MSIDFGNDIYEEPIVAKTFLAEDAQESSLRPKTLAEWTRNHLALILFILLEKLCNHIDLLLFLTYEIEL